MKKQGYTVFVERIQHTEQIDTHQSEMELDKIKSDFDHIITADTGDLSILKDWADEFIKRL